MVYMDTNESNTHADPLLGSRWAQMWVHMWAQTLVIFLVYVTKGNMYDEVYAEVINTNRFDEDTDLNTTYLGQVDMSRKTEVKAEEGFAMNAGGHTRGELLDGTECEIPIGTGMSKSYMSKSYYM